MVYTPNYFDIFNGVIEDWYPGGLGLDYHLFMRDRRIGLGYAHVEADFFIPGFFGDVLDIAVRLDRIGGASFSLTLHGFKGEEEALRGEMVVVATSLDGHRPIALPEDLRAALTTYQTLTSMEVTNG
jgi:4-hydroxybenzoyl-CoA thioesterase/acyl-CoA thioester hydrolase